MSDLFGMFNRLSKLAVAAVVAAPAFAAQANAGGYYEDVVMADSVDDRTIYLNGGEPYYFDLEGSCDYYGQDIDLRLFSANNYQAGADIRKSINDDCIERIAYTPRRSGYYVIEVENLGKRYNTGYTLSWE